MLKKVTVFAILIALVLASFPSLGVSASGVVDTKLEKKVGATGDQLQQPEFQSPQSS